MARALADMRPARWADLPLRLASAAVLLPIALLAVWLGGWAWALLVAVGAAGMAWEWANMFGRPVTRLPGMAVMAGVVGATVAAAAGFAGLVAAALAGGFLAAWGRGRLGFASGVLCIGVACVALVWLRSDAIVGPANLLFMLLVVWATDVGAYVVGRLAGGPKLAPAISPGKTWSGAVGGLVTAALVGEAYARAIYPSMPGAAAALAVALAAASQLGDLGESALKRWAGVKDSSRIIPGHGGLLDRLDGVLAAAPVAMALAAWVGRGKFLWQ